MHNMEILCYALSLGVSIFLVPFLTYGAAIILGFPLSGVMRKVTKEHKSHTLDIMLIMLLANIIDGVVSVLVTFLIFNAFGEALSQNKPLFIVMAVGKLVWVMHRSQILTAKPKDVAEEAINLLFYYIGLAGGVSFIVGF